jgi:hypothetical protein
MASMHFTWTSGIKEEGVQSAAGDAYSTGLDKQALSICVGMIEQGANPDTLAVRRTNCASLGIHRSLPLGPWLVAYSPAAPLRAMLMHPRPSSRNFGEKPQLSRRSRPLPAIDDISSLQTSLLYSTSPLYEYSSFSIVTPYPLC